MDQLYSAGSVLLAIAGVIATASVVVHARVPWRASVMGRHLMAYMTVVALVIDLGILRIFFADSFSFTLLRTIVFAGIPLVMGQRLWLQIHHQRDADRRAPADEADGPGR